MDDATFQQDVLPVLGDCSRTLVRASQSLKNQNAIVIIETEGLYFDLLYAFHKVVRKLPPGGGIDLILHSLGGSTDAASALASLCRERFGSFRVIIPFIAKSAATLLALSANERLLACSAQLGPVDPQVRHPEKGMYFPAHSIKEALEQVQATTDPIVKMAMADKLDPFLIGAYNDAINAAKQYIGEAADRWPNVDKETVISLFVEKYKSHGYPITKSTFESIKAPYSSLEPDAEDMICEIHERCYDLIDGGKEDTAILFTKDEYVYRAESYKHSGKFSSVPSAPSQPSAPATS